MPEPDATAAIVHLLWLGRVPYAEAMALQARVVAARKAGEIADTLLLLEHPPVLTLGRNAHRENILATDELLARRGVEIHESNRGGDVTYHGPGQLVGYPVLDLRGDLPGRTGPHLGPVDYVRLLEEVLIRACGELGVLAGRVKGRTGVWTLPGGSIRERKLAALGVHVSAGVTSHGFALNVTPDLRDFQLDHPLRHRRPRGHEPGARKPANPAAHAGRGHARRFPPLRPHLQPPDAARGHGGRAAGLICRPASLICPGTPATRSSNRSPIRPGQSGEQRSV